MADLHAVASRTPITPLTHLNLWCTPCGTVHALDLPDVERIVYALGLMVPVARQQVEDGGREYPHPECPRHVLKLATSSSWYGPAVAEAVANREAADDQSLPVASPHDVQVFAAGGRVITRFPDGTRVIREPLADGEALDRERAGHCDHDTIRYDDQDGVTRCAACHDPIPPGARL